MCFNLFISSYFVIRFLLRELSGKDISLTYTIFFAVSKYAILDLWKNRISMVTAQKRMTSIKCSCKE